MQVMLRASSRDELEAFARATLAPILEHDPPASRTELATTLRLPRRGSCPAADGRARTFTHVNTIAYRVGRIEQLLGRSLGDPSTVFDVTLDPADLRRGRRTLRARAVSRQRVDATRSL